MYNAQHARARGVRRRRPRTCTVAQHGACAARARGGDRRPTTHDHEEGAVYMPVAMRMRDMARSTSSSAQQQKRLSTMSPSSSSSSRHDVVVDDDDVRRCCLRQRQAPAMYARQAEQQARQQQQQNVPGSMIDLMYPPVRCVYLATSSAGTRTTAWPGESTIAKEEHEAPFLYRLVPPQQQRTPIKVMHGMRTSDQEHRQ